jgi:hypothetical protein
MYDSSSSSFIRESIADMLASSPRFVFQLASRAGAPVLGQGLTIRKGDTEYVDPDDPSKVYRTDLVLVAYAQSNGVEVPIHAVVVEVLDRKDPSRPPGWRVFPEAVRARYGCLGYVLIFAYDPDVRAWASAQALPHGVH